MIKFECNACGGRLNEAGKFLICENCGTKYLLGRDDEGQPFTWDALWYNPTITKVVIKEIHVQYMDNSEETIPGDQVLSLYDKNSEYKKQEDARKAAEAAEKAAEEARKQQQKEEALQALNGLKDSVVGGLKGLFKKK